MKILVTGGAGFIGSHLISKLLEKKHSVVILDNLSTGDKKNIISFSQNKKIEFINGSVLDEKLVSKLMDDDVDLVFHLAASVGVRLIVEQPVETISVNIRGTENILSAAVKNKTKVVLTSTSEIYGKSQDLPFKEEGDMLLGPTTNSRWSYACSKAIDEFLALAYFREKKIPVTIARLFNTIGPRQVGHYGMVVPRFVRQAIDGEPLTVYGDGSQTRVFCSVKDVVSALERIGASSDANGLIFNLGGVEEISIANLAKKVKTLSGSASEIVYIPYDQAYQKGFEDLTRRVPDISRAKKILKFEPKTSLDETLKQIIEHIKQTL